MTSYKARHLKEKRRTVLPDRRSLLVLLALVLAGTVFFHLSIQPQAHAPAVAETPPEPPARKIEIIDARILFTGDIMAHKPQIDAARAAGKNKGYNFSPQFEYIAPYFKRADLVVGNLETILAGKAVPYAGYPRFNAPDSLLHSLKNLGFGVLFLANNHALDYYSRGLARTGNLLIEHGFATGGVDFADDEREPLIVDVRGIKIGFLNYTYGSNMPIPADGARPAVISEDRIAEDVARMKERSPDIVVAYLHWGVEYMMKPTESQRELAKKIFASGVDAIVGAHPHVLQAVEMFDEESERPKAVAWSLGNFVSSQRTLPRERGAILAVELRKIASGDETNTALTKISAAPLWVQAVASPRGLMRVLYAGEGTSPPDGRHAAQMRSASKQVLGILQPIKSADADGFYTLWERRPQKPAN